MFKLQSTATCVELVPIPRASVQQLEHYAPSIFLDQPEPNSMNSQNPPTTEPAYLEDRDVFDDIDLRDIAATLLGSWPIILAFAVIGFCIGRYQVFVTPKTYQADALLQIESNSNQARIALSQTAELIEPRTELPSEIEILNSRMVLGEVAKQTGLDIVARPSFMPFVGEAIWRKHDGAQFGKPPGFVDPFVRDRHAWGGESITVSRLDVPQPLENRTFIVAASGDESYDLLDSQYRKLANGRVGELVTAELSQGLIQIYVRNLKSPPGRLFYVSKRSPQVAARKIRQSLNAKTRGGGRSSSPILELTYSSENPEEAERILNEVLSVFQQQNVERRSAEAEKTLEFLETQLPDLRDQVETAESRLNQFKVKQGTADLTQETSIVLERAVELDRARNELVQQRAEALRRYTDNHPVVESINEQIRQIDAQRSQVDARVQQLPDAQQQALRLTRDVEVLTELYVSLLNRAQELEVVKSGTIGNVRIIDPPVRPLAPSGPNTASLMGITFVASLLVAVTIILVRYFLHNGVNDPSVIEKTLGMATFGVIPFSPAQTKLLSSANSGESEISLLALKSPNSPTMEAVRSARTALFFAQMGAKNNIVSISGPEPGVGKTFISANLSAALAMADKRVLLIDADMRRGTLHEVFGADRSPGLSELISGQATIGEVASPTMIGNLYLIKSGTIPPNPAELLVSDRFSAAVKKLSESFDIVILDTPPVLAVTDAAVIGRLAATNFIVLKAGAHSIRMVEDTVKRFSASGASVTGTIFNQMGRNERGRYGYGYSYNYGARHGHYSYAYESKRGD